MTINAKMLLLILFWVAIALALPGCASWGTSHYAVEPFILDGKQICCRIVIENGKEIGQLKARFKKTGEDWDISLQEEGVKAFEGQAIASDLLKDVVPKVTDIVPLVP
jgi:hypothetical protein